MSSGPENWLIHGDNLAILRGEAPGIEPIPVESVDLVYLDPPFNSARSYESRGPDEPAVAFTDTWRWETRAWDAFHADPRNKKLVRPIQALRDLFGDTRMTAYLLMMGPRLIELHPVLSPTGSLVLHCDPTSSHYLKLLLDQVFGARNCLNEIVWHYGGRGAKAVAKRFGRNHDVLLFYAKKAGRHWFERQYVTRALSHREARLKGCRRDDAGRWFKTAPRGDYTDASVERLRAEGRIHGGPAGSIRVKYFLSADDRFVYEPVLLGDVWSDIPDAMHLGKERHGFPTQKPLALLERILVACTQPGDLVLDPFVGSGTTLVAAERLGRRWIGIDSSEHAICAARERLGPEASYVLERPSRDPDSS